MEIGKVSAGTTHEGTHSYHTTMHALNLLQN